ncbi:MAG: hypothetical protein ACREAC_12690, partial [Blastocatellia bacterium]
TRLGVNEERVEVYDEWRQAHQDEPLPDYFVTAMDLSPIEHIRVQAAITAVGRLIDLEDLQSARVLHAGSGSGNLRTALQIGLQGRKYLPRREPRRSGPERKTGS